jgi:glycosyltransferase involved in cell wall biosynthesis
MRKVLHLRTVVGRGGGPEKTILNSPRFLADEYRMRLAYLRPEGDPEYDMPARAARIGAALVDIPERGPIDPRAIRHLAREIRDFRPDILHAHDYKTNLLAVLLGPRYGARVVTTVHGYVVRSGRLSAYYLADRWSLRRMDHVIAVSEDLDALLQRWGIDRSRRTLVQNAIDTEAYARREPIPAAKSRLGLRPGGLVVGAVGRLSPEKGFDLLIRSLARLVSDGFDVELMIAGEGGERPRLEGLVRELGLDGRVRLLGHRTDVTELYQAMDVYVLSSLREGLPNVLLEAMAMGVPVVATRIAGVPRLVADEVSGLLVDPGSPDGLAAGMSRLLSDPEARARLGQSGRRTVEESFSFRVRMEKIRAIYDQVLGRGAVSPARHDVPTAIPS